MNRDDLRKILPHREPMLLVDEAYVDENAFKPETNARAAFKQNVTMSITKKQFRERLLKLFSEVSYGNFTVSPLNTTDSNKEEKFIVEATQFIFSDKVKYKEDDKYTKEQKELITAYDKLSNESKETIKNLIKNMK